MPMSNGSSFTSIFTSPQSAPGSSGWSPTIVYLLILTMAEMVVFHLISRVLR